MNEATARELLQRVAAGGDAPMPDWSGVRLRVAYEDHIRPIRAQSARLSWIETAISAVVSLSVGALGVWLVIAL